MTTMLCLIYDSRRMEPRVSQPFQKQASSQNLWSHWDLFHGFKWSLHQGPKEDFDGLDSISDSWFQERLCSSEKERAQWSDKDFLPWSSVSEILSPEYADRRTPTINTTGISPANTQLKFHLLHASVPAKCSDFGTLRKEAWELSGCVLFVAHFIKQHKNLTFWNRKR